MAVILDVLERVEGIPGSNDRLLIEVVSSVGPLPKWFSDSWVNIQRGATTADMLPVMVLNTKGNRADNLVCVLRLQDLERLLDNGD